MYKISVSIITPLYNSEKFIGKAIESVLSQTYKHWEMIIVDDCSTDNGAKIVKKYSQNENRIKYFKQNINKGPAKTRNKAIKLARGRYIAFLDSDDIWKENKLELQIKFMKKNSYQFTYTKFQKIDENGKQMKIINIPKKCDYDSALKINPIDCSTVIYDTHKIGKNYMPNIRKRQDYALWLKMLKKHGRAYGLNKVLTLYRVRKNSVSSNKINLIKYQWELYRNFENLSIFKSLYYLFWDIYSKLREIK